MTAKIHDVVDYVILKMDEGRVSLSLLKLQKLLYYVQAWSLALREEPAFDAKFQAWVHGPVSRAVYDRFKDTHSLYDSVGRGSVATDFRAENIPEDIRELTDEVLETYAEYSGSQLEAMTHREEPWVLARGSLPAASRCEAELDEAVMGSYYAKLLADAQPEQQAAQ